MQRLIVVFVATALVSGAFAGLVVLAENPVAHTAGLESVLVADPGPDPVLALDQAPSSCGLETAARYPEALEVGEVADIELEVRARCQPAPQPLDLVLAIDASMAGEPRSDLMGVATDLIRDLQLDAATDVRVGVVAYHAEAHVLCPLTPQAGRVIGCINRSGSGGAADIAVGVDAALGVLGQESTSEAKKLLVLLAGAGLEPDCDALQAADSRATELGVIVLGTCFGPDCNRSCYGSVLGDRYPDDPHELTDLLRAVSRETIDVTLERGSITTLRSNTLQVISGTVSPGGQIQEHQLVWELSRDAFDRPAANEAHITVGYQARASRSGAVLMRSAGEFQFVDSLGRPVSGGFEPLGIRVEAPTPTPGPAYHRYIPWSELP